MPVELLPLCEAFPMASCRVWSTAAQSNSPNDYYTPAAMQTVVVCGIGWHVGRVNNVHREPLPSFCTHLPAQCAGVRHLMWDHASYHNQIEKDSVLELDEVTKSSMAIIYTSGALSLLLGLYYY